MKMCPNCRNQISDEAVFCPICGSTVDAVPQYQPQKPVPNLPYDPTFTQPPVSPTPVSYIDPFDHTTDFDAADISENKVVSMLVYLLGPVGIIIALLASNVSQYAAFHVRQALKLTVVDTLAVPVLFIAACLLDLIRLRGFMVFLVGLALIGLVAIHLISFLQVCKGKAKEPIFVRRLRFLK